MKPPDLQTYLQVHSAFSHCIRNTVPIPQLTFRALSSTMPRLYSTTRLPRISSV